MHIPVADRPLSEPEVRAVRERLVSMHAHLDEQMDRATTALDLLRTTSDVADPDVQPPLMSALRLLDGAEREASDVIDALTRLADGRYGRCDDCGAQIPVEVLLDRPLTRTCPR